MRKIIKTVILFFAFLIGAGDYYIANAKTTSDKEPVQVLRKRYRYYPESNVYFNPLSKRYTYQNNGRWTTAATLPNNIRVTGRYNDFDYDGDNPWNDNSKHKNQYKTANGTTVVKINDDYYKTNNGNGNGKGNNGNGKGNNGNGNGKKNK
jgi:hypothetical protein